MNIGKIVRNFFLSIVIAIIGILVFGAISSAKPNEQIYAWSVLGGVALITIIACCWKKK